MEEMGILVSAIVFIASLVIGLTLHEVMHALVGYALGDDTAKRQGRVTLNPLAHIDPVMTVAVPLVMFVFWGIIFGAAKPVPFNPRNLRWGEYGMALVALAGPLTNLLLAFVGGFIFHFLGAGFWAEALKIFIFSNVVFFVLNMLPIPPLDGSRVLYVFMPNGVRDFMIAMERFGLLLVFFVFIFLYKYISPLLEWVFDFITNF